MKSCPLWLPYELTNNQVHSRITVAIERHESCNNHLICMSLTTWQANLYTYLASSAAKTQKRLHGQRRALAYTQHDPNRLEAGGRPAQHGVCVSAGMPAQLHIACCRTCTYASFQLSHCQPQCCSCCRFASS